VVLTRVFSPVYSWLMRCGLPTPVGLVIIPGALAGALSTVLAGIAGSLSGLFLMIMLFLLAEGPAMMNRLRTNAAAENHQVERPAVVGQNVVRQLGLRIIVNHESDRLLPRLNLVLRETRGL
jgi:hypothetical protein